MSKESKRAVKPVAEKPSTPAEKEVRIASFDFTKQPELYLTVGSIKFGVDRATIIEHSVVLAESLNDKDAKEVEVASVRADILFEALKYMYTPVWVQEYTPASPVYYAGMIPFAFQYDCKALLNFCETMIIKRGKLDCASLRTADEYKLKLLKTAAISNIVQSRGTLTERARAHLAVCSKETLVELTAELCGNRK